MKTKKALFTSLAIIGLLLISVWGFSQSYWHNSNWSDNSGYSWWNYNTPSEYVLTSQQVSKMNKIRNENHKKSLKIKKEIQDLRWEYSEINSSTNPDTDKLESLRKKIINKEQQLWDANIKTKTQIRKMLNKRQLAYFNNNNYRWWNMDRNCWYNDDAGMYSSRTRWNKRNCW